MCLSLGANTFGAPPRTYQGKPLPVWLGAMLYDLDPEYRRTSREAVVHFGGEAIPSLKRILDKNEEPEGVALATGALIRIGPAGRAIVASKLATGLLSPDRSAQAALLHVIRGIGDAGPLARPFIPHLRTLVNSPEVSLIALRVLAQTDGAAASGPAAGAMEDLESTGPGVTVSMTPYDCFVENRFGAIRARVRLASGVVARSVRLILKSALDADAAYYTVARAVDGSVEGYQTYEAIMPKPLLGATALSYQVSVETTNQVTVTTDAVTAGVATTEEGCALIGGRAVPEPVPSPKLLEVFAHKPR